MYGQKCKCTARVGGINIPSFPHCNNFLIIGKAHFELSEGLQVFHLFTCLFGVLATFRCKDPNKFYRDCILRLQRKHWSSFSGCCCGVPTASSVKISQATAGRQADSRGGGKIGSRDLRCFLIHSHLCLEPSQHLFGRLAQHMLQDNFFGSCFGKLFGPCGLGL